MKRALLLGAVLGLAAGGPLQALTLDALLAQTLARNPRIQQAQTELQAAAGERLPPARARFA